MATTMADVSSKQLERERKSLEKAREIALSQKRMNVKVRLNPEVCCSGLHLFFLHKFIDKTHLLLFVI